MIDLRSRFRFGSDEVDRPSPPVKRIVRGDSVILSHVLKSLILTGFLIINIPPEARIIDHGDEKDLSVTANRVRHG